MSVYDDGDRDPAVLIGRDECSHQANHVGGEEWVERGLVDAERLAVRPLAPGEAGLLEFATEVGLGERAGDAAGPGGRLGEYLRGQVVLFDRQVRHAQTTAGSRYAAASVPRA